MTEATRRNAIVFAWQGAELKNVVGMGEASAAGLPAETGVLFVEVPTDSAANKAGLKTGDVIVKFEEKPVTDVGDLLRLYCAAAPRSTVKLGVWRDQKDKAIAIERGPQIVLRAATAQVSGEGHRPVYDAQKDFLGSWSNREVQLSWKSVVPESGSYSVQLLLACSPDSAGSTFELVVGEKKLKGIVEKTGHWEDFALKAVGRVELKKGANIEVTLRPLIKPATAVMNLRVVILEPIP